jgi:hypothetical protein
MPDDKIVKGEYAVRPDHTHHGKFKVVNTVTGQVHGTNMTKENADSQRQLLFAVGHGWKPAH